MKSKKRDKMQKFFIALILIIGLLILFYPVYSNYINRRIALSKIKDYNHSLQSKPKEEKQEELKKAYVYNENLVGEAVPESFAKRVGIKHDRKYESKLNVLNNGMMGILSVPSIDVNLPIYHYTTESILEKGAGHLFGSSLPVGGKSTHAVITAHRGLPSAKMFTDLDLLKKGDKFFVHTLGKKMAYEIDRIKTVKPDETKGMGIEKGKDYVTLVTCTPYGKNTHRLLVRGHRVPYRDENMKNQISRHKVSWMHVISIVAGILLAIIGYFGISMGRQKKLFRWFHS